MTDDRAEQVVIGRVDAPYGVQGWVRIFSYTDPMETILEYSPWLMVKRGKVWTQPIATGRKQGRGLIALPEGFTDRSQAEALVGAEIRVEKSRLPALAMDEYYWHQLEGLAVVSERGERFGIVDHLIETGASDVLVVRADDGSIDDRERLIPFVADRVVKRVDLDRGEVIVDWQADY